MMSEYAKVFQELMESESILKGKCREFKSLFKAQWVSFLGCTDDLIEIDLTEVQIVNAKSFVRNLRVTVRLEDHDGHKGSISSNAVLGFEAPDQMQVIYDENKYPFPSHANPLMEAMWGDIKSDFITKMLR